MKRMYEFLSRSFACWAVTLVILSALAMPTQGVKANDSSPNTGPPSNYTCAIYDPYNCEVDPCMDQFNQPTGGLCSDLCGC